MKVLTVTNLYPPQFLGGYELGCSQMVKALGEAGHQVRVVTSVSAPGVGEEDEVRRILELPPIYGPARMQSVSPEVHQYFNLISCTVNAANALALGQAIEEFEPDIAYLWNLLGVGGLGVLALLDHWGIPWVWHLMDVIPRQVCGLGTSGPEIARELGGVFPGRYIVCSTHLLGEILEGGVELGEHVTVIPNWVHGDPPRRRTAFFAGGELRVLTASGALCEAKGTHILIEAAARVRDRGFANFTIDIYGHEDDPRFRTLLYKHDVADIVRVMGPRTHSKLLALYGSYDLFAFPTWSREPFGFAPLEAAAAGCVPLVTADCGLAEWMIDGVDCLKALRHPEDFADRMTEVLRGEIDLGPLARRGQGVAWREFHLSRAAAGVERVLEAAAAEGGTRRGDPAEFYLLARYAEGVIHAILHERG